MDNSIFQNVFDVIQPMLPEVWEKVVLFVGYTEGSYSMKYYIFDKADNYVDCFSQKDLTRAQLIKSFMNINKVLKVQRSELDDKDRWSVMTMIVYSDGSMITDFDYTDISENLIEYQEYWEKKYL